MKTFAIAIAMFVISTAYAQTSVFQWVNTAGAIQSVPVGSGNRFIRIASVRVTVPALSTVIVTGVTESFLTTCTGPCMAGAPYSMGGMYRVGLLNGVSTVRFSSSMMGGAANMMITQTSQVPLNTTSVTPNVPAGTYDAFIEIYGNEAAQTLPVRYLPKSLIVQVIQN